jgi:hypothetical protein
MFAPVQAKRNFNPFDHPTETKDHETLLFIQNILNGTVGGAATIVDIAQIMHEAGYEINDLTD